MYLDYRTLKYDYSKQLTTLACPVDAVGDIEKSEEYTTDLFFRVNVSENHRSGWMVHSIGVFVMKVIGSVTAPVMS